MKTKKTDPAKCKPMTPRLWWWWWSSTHSHPTFFSCYADKRGVWASIVWFLSWRWLVQVLTEPVADDVLLFFFLFPPQRCALSYSSYSPSMNHRVCILSNESTQTRLVSREYRGIFTRTGALPYAQCLMHDKLQDDCQSANPTSSPFLDTSVLVGLRQIPSAVFFYFSGIYTHTHTNIIIIDR